MALFGLTRHGDYNHLLNTQPAHRPAGFANIDDATFEQEFDRHVMGDCPESKALEVSLRLNGQTCLPTRGQREASEPGMARVVLCQLVAVPVWCQSGAVPCSPEWCC